MQAKPLQKPVRCHALRPHTAAPRGPLCWCAVCTSSVTYTDSRSCGPHLVPRPKTTCRSTESSRV
eukprot:363388-Chlamydomonas_euryale.AAC.3